MKLRLPREQVDRHLATIQHDRFQQALPRYWHVDSRGQVRAQSLLWLFCWAKTGLNSEQTAHQVRNIINQIFDHSYEWLEARISHDYARKARYAAGDIEADFQAKLSVD